MNEATEFDGSGTLILAPRELRKGMYVAYLDRPWADSSFPFQGFRIETEEELSKIRESCEYVFVDSRRESGHDYQQYHERQRKASVGEDAPAPAPEQSGPRPPTEKEFPVARKVYAEFRDAMIECYATASTGGKPQLNSLKLAARNVIESVRRNPDALLYFVRTQTDGDYLFRHGVACAVMLCALGHSMKMSSKSLEWLTLGGALIDIGKTRVPRELLNRPTALEFTPAEMRQMRYHIERGAEVLSHATSEGSPIVTMIMTHHERYNGKGYPRGLAGDEIPKFGQMAGIVDMFDAMVSERSYGRRATSYEAMRYIGAQRGEEFSEKLVKAFRKAFGTYPTGTLVQLSTGEVGFVIQQNPESRLHPRVYLILDEKQQRLSEFKVRNLLEHKTVCVDNCLRAGSFGIGY